MSTAPARYNAAGLPAGARILSKLLFQSTLRVGAVTFLSRILGFVRDVVVANLFGASAAADAFFVAFKIPNFLRRLFAEGAFSQAFVPVLAEYKERQESGSVQGLVDHTAGTLAAVLLTTTLVGMVAAPVFISVFAPGFLDDPGQFGLAAYMLRITFPYLFFISLAAFAAAILNSYGRFGVPAFTPVLLNLSMIGAAVLLSPRMAEPVTALAWGVVLGGAAQFLFQLPFIWRLGLRPRPRWGIAHAGVRRILKLMGPALFAVSVSQINLLLDTLIASFLAAGSISWLYYSDRLVEFPLGVFGIALGTVILPSLSERHAQGHHHGFSDTLDWALRLIVYIATPAAVGLAVLAAPALATLFQYGEFTALDVVRASYSLMAYSAGLLGFTFIKVLAPGFFARQDTRTPVRIGVWAMLANMALNLALVFPLKHAGLALATSLAALLNAGLLYRVLRQRQIYQPHAGWGRVWLTTALACGAMAGTLLLLNPALSTWIGWPAWQRGATLTALVALGGGIYLGALLLQGVRPGALIGRGPESV